MNTRYRIILIVSTAIMAAAGLAGCGSGGVVAPRMPATAGPQRWHEELTGYGLWNVWGTGKNLLFSTGGSGYISRYNGTDWVVLPTGVSGSALALWGTSAENVYAIVGNDVIHFDGTAWQPAYHAADALTNIWGSSANDIFAVGNNGTIVHYDGAAWTPQDSGVDWLLQNVAGTGPHDVYAQGAYVGTDQYVLHYNGSTWQELTVETTASITSLAVNREGRAFEGDDDGWIYLGGASWHYLGVAPQSLASPDSLELFGTDSDGRVFHSENTNPAAWSSFPSHVRRVWSAPWGYTYGAGLDGQIVYYDGAQWSTLRAARPAGQLNAIFGAPDGARFVIGAGSYFFDGADWVERPLANAQADRAGWAVSKDFAIAVGNGGAINRWNGAAWQDVTSHTSANLVGAWASSETDAFAVGGDGTVLHDDGSGWSVMTTLPYHLSGIHGTGPDDVWAAPSVAGAVFHYDGTSWNQMTLPTTQLLTSIWALSPADVFAVGYGGVAVRYDGNEWKELQTPTDQNLIDVWARGPNAAFALADDGEVIRFDGSKWKNFATTPGGAALDLWGDSNHLFAAGQVTSVFRLGI
jgi:hypothetical protein